MKSYSGKKLNRLIKTWNNGRIPKTKKGYASLLEKINDELGSGWWANQKEPLSELRYMKFGIQKRMKNFE